MTMTTTAAAAASSLASLYETELPLALNLAQDGMRTRTVSTICPCGFKHWLRGAECDYVTRLKMLVLGSALFGFDTTTGTLRTAARRFVALRGVPPDSVLGDALVHGITTAVASIAPTRKSAPDGDGDADDDDDADLMTLFPPSVDTCEEEFDEAMAGVGREALLVAGIDAASPYIIADEAHVLVSATAACGPCVCRKRHSVYTDEVDFAVAFASECGVAYCGWNMGEDPAADTSVRLQQLFHRLRIDPERTPV
jgi:hypothetical protein